MANKVYILTEERVKAIDEWYSESFKKGCYLKAGEYLDWLKLNPCPLPEPVEVPSDENIDSEAYSQHEYTPFFGGDIQYPFNHKEPRGFIEGAKWMRDLILTNK